MTPPPYTSADSDRQRLVSDRGRRSSQSNQNGEDRIAGLVSHLAVGFALLGLALAAFGFLYPRDLQRDPDASARENEQADQAYMKLSTALDAVIITGMILIAMGGLILATIFTSSVLCDRCGSKKTASTQSQEMTSCHTVVPATTSVAPQPATSSCPPPPLSSSSSSHRANAGLDYGTVLSSLQ